jgi:hypothetical protein
MSQSEDKMKLKFDFLSIKAGDVIFVLPHSSGLSKLTQVANVHGQHLLAKLRKSNRLPIKASVRKYSHVILGLGDGLIIHADGKKVALEVVTDALDIESTRYQVFRHTGLSDETVDKIVKAGMRYMQQKYSFIKYFGKPKENDTTQFCSRLVAHAYRYAGVPLSKLPDKDVLPLDLYLLCQQPPWSEVTDETVHQFSSPEMDNFVGDIEVPGRGKMSFSELFDSSDKLLLKCVQSRKQVLEIHYRNYRNILHVQALLAQYCSAVFVLAKQLYVNPLDIDDAFAEKIANVLSQIDVLLDLAHLPDVDLLIEHTLVNTDADGSGEGAYVDMPAPTVIRELQTNREMIRIYTGLLMAEIGMFSILAQAFPNEKFDAFKDVKPEYVAEFLAALPRVDALPKDEDEANLFTWVDNDADRAFCVSTYKNLIVFLELIEIMALRA